MYVTRLTMAIVALFVANTMTAVLRGERLAEGFCPQAQTFVACHFYYQISKFDHTNA